MLNKSDVVKDLVCLPRVSKRTEEMVRLLRGLIERFVYFEEKVFFNVLIIYVILSYFSDIFEAVPYLQILGQYGSGKSRAGDFLGKLCSNPLSTGDISDAALFRAIDERGDPQRLLMRPMTSVAEHAVVFFCGF